MLLVGFFLALVGLAGAYIWKKSSQVAPVTKRPAQKLPTFLVASTDLPEGRVIHSSDFMQIAITNEQLSKKQWPPILMADGKQLVNRRLKVATKQGEPFPPDAFYPEGIEQDLTQRLPIGMRAITVEVPNVGLPSKTSPGAIVDVLFTSHGGKSGLPQLTKSLVEGVQILAIGNSATPGDTVSG